MQSPIYAWGADFLVPAGRPRLTVPPAATRAARAANVAWRFEPATTGRPFLPVDFSEFVITFIYMCFLLYLNITSVPREAKPRYIPFYIPVAIPVNLCLKQVYIFSIGEFGSASNEGYHR